MQFQTLAKLYQYFDNLAEQETSSDELFASSYIRGFIGLSASEFGDEQQTLSIALANTVSEKLYEARAELTPQDRVIVNEYWQEMIPIFN
ncbi:MAG: YfcL family protein [Alteromonadaceae bacterium]|tara:strand:- start:444 stop:713 length:270 start_codon:yes stop_codon:yes gene_type:complete